MFPSVAVIFTPIAKIKDATPIFVNAVERAVVLSRSEFLDADELSLLMAEDAVDEKINQSEAARRLGITRKTLRSKLEKYEGTV